jgi:hypothetical protein
MSDTIWSTDSDLTRRRAPSRVELIDNLFYSIDDGLNLGELHGGYDMVLRVVFLFQEPCRRHGGSLLGHRYVEPLNAKSRGDSVGPDSG